MTPKIFRVSYASFLGGGILYLYASLGLPMGKAESPASGLFPFLDAVFIVATSLALLIGSWSQKKIRLDTIEPFPKGKDLRRVVLVAVTLILYGLGLRFLGYMLCTTGLMAIVLRLLGMKGWIKLTLATILTGLISYWLFIFALEVPLPRGEVLP